MTGARTYVRDDGQGGKELCIHLPDEDRHIAIALDPSRRLEIALDLLKGLKLDSNT